MMSREYPVQMHSLFEDPLRQEAYLLTCQRMNR